MADECSLCGGAGMRILERADGTRVARPCDCRERLRLAGRLDSAKIPNRHAGSTLENYATNFAGSDPSLARAQSDARNFVTEYSPIQTYGRGLMFVGRPGLGKTHLSVGLLKELIVKRHVQGLFVDYRDLLKQIQNSYNPSVSTTELGILQPIFEAEVVVIDDLGASKPTDWVFDTVAHLLNSRYNNKLTTIITTNFANAPETSPEDLAMKSDAQRMMHARTLGDRVGDRVLSRLHEMCVVINMYGADFRRSVNRADFRNTATPEEFLPPPTIPERKTEASAFEQGKELVGAARLGKPKPVRSNPQIEGLPDPMPCEAEETEKSWTQDDLDRAVEQATRRRNSRL